MTAELVSRSALRRAAGWAGRASQHRREQVRTQATPVAAAPALWSSLVDVLRAIDGPSSALLCTMTGSPVATHGLARTEVAQATIDARRAFAAAARAGATAAGIETVELTVGARHTVIASVPDAVHGHLLSVSAEGVSAPLLRAWTQRAAEDLQELLVTEPWARSSSAAE
ncbi:hypothetical protein [Nocardioides sp. SYSU D00065]|uniref:hypothetical protein n=1 Tax=Nocardioides sp. SYSU D00065 TaxID=2817378 RepID=UPI001B31C5CC|nr:hypothetical protein [Nocardioides sp. SYSU D00065]